MTSLLDLIASSQTPPLVTATPNCTLNRRSKGHS